MSPLELLRGAQAAKVSVARKGADVALSPKERLHQAYAELSDGLGVADARSKPIDLVAAEAFTEADRLMRPTRSPSAEEEEEEGRLRAPSPSLTAVGHGLQARASDEPAVTGADAANAANAAGVLADAIDAAGASSAAGLRERLQASVQEVSAGLGFDRARPKPAAMLAVEAFEEARHLSKTLLRPGGSGGSARPRPPPPPRVRRLDSAIARLRTLQPSYVELSECLELGDAGIAALCSALLRHAPLVTLRLARTGCGFAGAAAVAELVAVHLNLRHCELSRNDAIGDTGATSLARALRASRRLESLGLRACGLSDEAALALADALTARPRAPLAAIDLAHNTGIGRAGVQALRDAAARCRHLRRLDCSGADAAPDALAALQLSLAPQHKETRSGGELWRGGLHTAFTLRFAEAEEVMAVPSAAEVDT